jgi:2-dehydro-3-deoxy-D-gluconate 5-dehydrogenase
MPTTNLFDLSGRVAVVTGGNGGIGRGIALGLAQAGAAIAVLARNEEKNQRVMSELQSLGVAALAVKVDVSARGELQPALKKVEETLGPVSILVNSAGISIVAGVLDQTPEDWDKVRICSFLQRCERSFSTTDQIDGDRAGAVQYSGERNRTWVD